MSAEQWKAFKTEHGKSYTSEEDDKRFEIFKENLKMVDEHNEKYDKKEVTFKMGLNKFTDMLPEEKGQMFGLLQPPADKK